MFADHPHPRIIQSPFLEVAMEIELSGLSCSRFHNSVLTVSHSQSSLRIWWSIKKGTKRLVSNSIAWGIASGLPGSKSPSPQNLLASKTCIYSCTIRNSRWVCRLFSYLQQTAETLFPGHPMLTVLSTGGLRRLVSYLAWQINLDRGRLLRTLEQGCNGENLSLWVKIKRDMLSHLLPGTAINGR